MLRVNRQSLVPSPGERSQPAMKYGQATKEELRLDKELWKVVDELESRLWEDGVPIELPDKGRVLRQLLEGRGFGLVQVRDDIGETGYPSEAECAGEEKTEGKEPPRAQIIDLMEALKASLKAAKGR